MMREISTTAAHFEKNESRGVNWHRRIITRAYQAPMEASCKCTLLSTQTQPNEENIVVSDDSAKQTFLAKQ